MSQLNIPLGGSAVVLSYGTLAAKTTFRIPVESNVTELTVFSAIQRKDLALLIKPDGTIVRDGIQSYQHMLIAHVPSPAAGVWSLELEGAGLYSVTAHVKGDASFTFDFDKCAPNVSSAVKNVELSFVNADGSVIGAVTTDCGAPDTAYRVMLRGVDATGAKVQRITNAIHAARTVR